MGKRIVSLVVLDTETGGLNPFEHSVIEIAACNAIINPNNHTVRTRDLPFHEKVLPDRPVDPQAAAVNGYTPELWTADGARSMYDVSMSFLFWLDQVVGNDLVWAGSNVLGFDLPFLREGIRRAHSTSRHLPSKPKFSRRTLNTESLCFPLYVAGEIDHCGVEALRAWAGLPGKQTHAALQDVSDTIDVIRAYFERVVWGM